jgi:colanic acid/amylovoran biosynthesis glycosyltransferase
MKVCFAAHDSPWEVSGVSTWLQRLLPLLKLAGIELEVHAMGLGGTPGANCAYFEQQGIPVRWTPCEPYLPKVVRPLVNFLEEGQPDVYVPNCIAASYYAGRYVRRAGIQTVGVLHSDDPFYWAIADEFVYGDPDLCVSAVVPVSSFLETSVRSKAAARGVIVRRIGCGVPIPSKTTELSSSVFRLVYTGRLVEEQKRISDVTTALCHITQSIPRLEAWIVGEGDARPAVEMIIREKGMDSRVHLLGRVDNAQIYDLLAHCHCLVLLSDYEGLPVSVLEAMAAGVVPICLDARSGIREAIEHGVNGLIVQDRTAAFFAAVKELQSNPVKWRQLSLAARDTAERRYSVEECARQWIDLLQLLNLKRSVRTEFRAPRYLKLPRPDARLRHDFRFPWKSRLRESIRSIPPIYRAATAAVAVIRKIRNKKDRIIQDQH